MRVCVYTERERDNICLKQKSSTGRPFFAPLLQWHAFQLDAACATGKMCNKIKMRTYADLHIETVTAAAAATAAVASTTMATSGKETERERDGERG